MSRERPARKVNWNQAVAEVALILAGVFIALTVDNWWAARQEEQEKLSYLSAMLEEFQSNRQSLVESIEIQKKIISTGTEILRMIAAGVADQDGNEFFGKLGEIYFFEEWVPTNAAYDDLVSAGRLLLIDNLGLRKELSAFQRHLVSIRHYEELQSGTYYENQAPFINQVFNGAEQFWNVNSDWLEGDRPPPFPYKLDLAVFDTPEFWNLIVEWMWVHADVVSAYQAAIVACDQIIELIDLELAAKNK